MTCVLHLLLSGHFVHTLSSFRLNFEFCSTYLISFILYVHTYHDISMHSALTSQGPQQQYSWFGNVQYCIDSHLESKQGYTSCQLCS